MTDGESLIKVSAKTPTQTYTVEVSTNATVSDLKDKLLPQVANATKERLCVIYTGKILKDEETLAQHKIGDGHTVHLVIRNVARATAGGTTSSAPPASAQPPPAYSAAAADSQQQQQPQNANRNPLRFGGAAEIMNNPDMMREMFDSPIMQSMMNNPELMRSILGSNPQFQELIERNPEVGHMLNDPSIMRQTMEMIRNPNMFQEMMRNHDIAIRNLQGIPGGEAALERLYNDVQEPLMNSAGSTLGGNPFASLRNENQQNEPRVDRAGQENNEALPNPWAPRTNTTSSAQQAGNAAGTGAGTGAGANPMAGILNSPGYSQLMQQMMSDPSVASSLFSPEMMGMMRQTLQSNPQLINSFINASPAAQSNPEVAQAMRDRLPDLLGMMSNPQFVSAMANPRVTQAVQQIQQGVETLRSEAPQLLTMMGGLGAGIPHGPGTGTAGNAAEIGAGLGQLSNLFGSMGLGGLGGAAPSGAAAAPAANPEQQYASQLEQLQSMGFSNRAANIAALTASFGDLNAAVERLLNSPQ